MSKKISVLMTGPLLTENPGGIQTHVQNFIGAFSTSSTIDFRFFPVTLGLYDREGWVAKARRFIGGLIPFGRAVRAVNAVHINSTFDNRSLIRDGMYLLIAKWLLGKPVVLQFHGGLPKQVGLLRSAFLVRLFNCLLGSASQVLILSRIQGGEFSQLFPEVGYTLVPNFIDCDNGAEPANSEPHVPIRFLFMGRLHENKGIKEIVSASRVLAGKGYDFSVEFCGDGPLKSWLENEIAELAVVPPYLIYNGVAYGAKKEAALVRADVMLLPSSHPEGFPYAILEASKFGMPTIATPLGAIPDVIVSGKNGLLIPERNTDALAVQMEFAISNPEAVQTMGICARKQVVAEFSIESLRRMFEAMYTTTAGVR